jgi:hypothetical protein
MLWRPWWATGVMVPVFRATVEAMRNSESVVLEEMRAQTAEVELVKNGVEGEGVEWSEVK